MHGQYRGYAGIVGKRAEVGDFAPGSLPPITVSPKETRDVGLKRCRQTTTLIDGSFGIQLSSHVGSANDMRFPANRL